MDKFKFTPENGFLDSLSYPEPQNEEETRTQLFSLHQQLRDFVNDVVTMSGNEVVKLRINDGVVEYSSDGDSWTSVSGFSVKNEEGTTLPNKKYLQFTNSSVSVESDRIVVNPNGSKGDPGAGVPTGGLAGDIIAKRSNVDMDTEWMSLSDNQTIIDLNSALDSATRRVSTIEQRLANAESRLNNTKEYSNISVSATPTALGSYKAWDTQNLYGYSFDVTINGLTNKSFIENIVLTDTLLATVGYMVTTDTNKITFYTQTNDVVSGTIISLLTNEVA